ncbi:hypothetical protein [uncultured Nostoc sp.]
MIATRAGVSKIPAPMTIPTITATASSNVSDGLGAATSVVAVC